MTLSHSPFTTFCTRLTPYVGAKLVSEVRVNYWAQCLCMLPSTTWDQHCLLLPSFQPLIQWTTSHTNLVQQCKCYKNIDSKGVKCARLPHQPHLQQYESDWENSSHPRQSQSVWLQKLIYLFLQFILWYHTSSLRNTRNSESSFFWSMFMWSKGLTKMSRACFTLSTLRSLSSWRLTSNRPLGFPPDFFQGRPIFGFFFLPLPLVRRPCVENQHKFQSLCDL